MWVTQIPSKLVRVNPPFNQMHISAPVLCWNLTVADPCKREGKYDVCISMMWLHENSCAILRGRGGGGGISPITPPTTGFKK